MALHASLLLTALCTGTLLVGCAEKAQPVQGTDEQTPWFNRDPWRPAPAEDSEEPPQKKPNPAPTPADAVPLRPLTAIPGAMLPHDAALIPWLPGSSSDTITLRDGHSDYSLTNTLVQASARTAFIAYQGGGPYRGTRITNCVLRVDPGTVPEGKSYWAMRGYDMLDTVLDRVEITGFGQPTSGHDEGHAIYFNVLGSLAIVDSFIHHNGGQGLQLVNRPYESNAGPGPATGTITIRQTWFHENGFNPDRAGSQVSIFGTGQDIILESVEILAGHDHTKYEQGQSPGGLLIEAEAPRTDKHNAWWRPIEVPDDYEIPFTQGTVTLDSVLVDHRSPNRPIVQIKGCKELVVRGSVFRGGRVALDDPTKPGRNNGRIEWSGNAGDAVVFVGGVRVGTADQDFTAEDGRLR